MHEMVARLLRGVAGGVLVGNFAMILLAIYDATVEDGGSLGKIETISWQIGLLAVPLFALYPLPGRWPWLWAILRGLPWPVLSWLLVEAQSSLDTNLHHADPLVFEFLFWTPMVAFGVPLRLWRSLGAHDADKADPA